MSAKSRRLLNAVLDEMRIMSNFEVDILMMHGGEDELDRGDRYALEERLEAVLEREMES